MDQRSGYSPSFKRPVEIMRMRRKRARSDAAVLRFPGGRDSSTSPGESSSSSACVRPFSPGPLFNTQSRRNQGGTKRRNPFANIENTENNYSPQKKLFICKDKDGETEKEEDEEVTESSWVEEGQQNRTIKSSESPASTPPASIPPASISPASIPPASIPPASIPPASISPASIPPASIPPASISPASIPPASIPPASIPPASIPPASISPASIPPASIPPASISPASIPPASIPPASISPASIPPASIPPASISPASIPPASISPASIPPASISPASISPPVCTEYPADWSLKTRALFTSPVSLSWTEQPKAQEEAAGLSHSCRAQFFSPPHSLQDPRSCSELRSAFQQGLVYWQHPSLPWLSLFPRINAERNFSGRSTPWAQDAAMQQSLMREWSVSLSSLYNLLKSRLCPYFYLCSYQFTVLYRAAGLGGSGNITALISPTTRGLREAMKAEGIEFSLPLVERKRRSRDPQSLMDDEGEEDGGEKESRSQQEEGEDDDDGEDEDGSFSWLREMGVQDKIRRPDGITIQLRKEANSVCLDHKPESVVCVEGSHTFTLINFLINWKGVVAAAGSQAGLPPTLLAPAAFRGATMQMLKVRSVNVKSQVGSTYQNISSLEITGPILPSSLHAITTLLRPAQKGNFSAVLYTHQPSAVMNVNSRTQQNLQLGRPQPAREVKMESVAPRADWPVDLSGCGLRAASIQQLQQPSSLEKTALTHLAMSDYGYTWKS